MGTMSGHMSNNMGADAVFSDANAFPIGAFWILAGSAGVTLLILVILRASHLFPRVPCIYTPPKVRAIMYMWWIVLFCSPFLLVGMMALVRYRMTTCPKVALITLAVVLAALVVWEVIVCHLLSVFGHSHLFTKEQEKKVQEYRKSHGMDCYGRNISGDAANININSNININRKNENINMNSNININGENNSNVVVLSRTSNRISRRHHRSTISASEFNEEEGCNGSKPVVKQQGEDLV